MNVPDVDRPPIDFALYLAGHGLRIIPIPPRSKKPILNDWPTVATSNPYASKRFAVSSLCVNSAIASSVTSLES